jgi:hypothetical protein
MPKTTWSRNWRRRLDDAVDDAVDARERLRQKDSQHSLLEYSVDPNADDWIAGKVCERFWPKEMGDWRKDVPAGAAILTSLEHYTREVEEVLAG